MKFEVVRQTLMALVSDGTITQVQTFDIDHAHPNEIERQLTCRAFLTTRGPMPLRAEGMGMSIPGALGCALTSLRREIIRARDEAQQRVTTSDELLTRCTLAGLDEDEPPF